MNVTQHRKVERPCPVPQGRNPHNPEMWLTEQQKRNVEFADTLGRLMK